MDISIVTGTYNRLKYLKAMIDSVRASIGVGMLYEIVVVDGGSDDGTLDWCKQQPDIVLIEHGKLLGAVRAFNDGAYAARGDYVILANDDIVFIGDSILYAYAYMQDHPSTGMGCFMQDRDNLPWHVSYMGATDEESGKRINVPYGQVCIVPKFLGDRLGWWGNYLRTYGGDNELTCNVYEIGYSVDVLHCACIHDIRVSDNLRNVNSGNSNSITHPDSALWKDKWYGNGFGAMVRKKPAVDNVLPRKLRILYLPIFDRLRSQLHNRKGLRNALSKIGVVHEHDYMNDGLGIVPDLAASFMPDIVLTQFHNTVVDELLHAVKRAVPSHCKFVNWNGDYHYKELVYSPYISMLKQYDIAAHVTADIRDIYVGNGIHWEYWQSSWEDVDCTKPVRQIYDVSFLGNCYSSARMEFDKVLALIGSQYKLAISGVRWQESSKYIVSNTLYNFQAGADLYRQSKLTISDQQWPHATGYVSDRLFNSLHAGVCVLQRRFDGIESYLGLKHNEHLVLYDTNEELLSCIRELLSDDERRNAISMAGKKYIDTYHSFDVRVKELMAML